MKTKTLVLFIVMLSFGLMSSTCSKDDDSSSDDDQSQIPGWVQTAKVGTWKISLYKDDGEDETYHYTGYAFTFGDNNVLTAVKGDDTTTGSWSITHDSSSGDDDDGGSSGDVDFNIFFSAPPVLEELSDDWDIINITSSKIELVDVSGGNGGTDHLTFVKI